MPVEGVPAKPGGLLPRPWGRVASSEWRVTSREVASGEWLVARRRGKSRKSFWLLLARHSQHATRHFLARNTPLVTRHSPRGEEPAEVGVALLRLGQQGQVAAVVKGDLRADDGVEAVRLRRAPEGDDPVQPVVVGEGQGRQAQHHSALDQGLRRRGAVQQREVAVAVQLAVHGESDE